MCYCDEEIREGRSCLSIRASTGSEWKESSGLVIGRGVASEDLCYHIEFGCLWKWQGLGRGLYQASHNYLCPRKLCKLGSANNLQTVGGTVITLLQLPG